MKAESILLLFYVCPLAYHATERQASPVETLRLVMVRDGSMISFDDDASICLLTLTIGEQDVDT